MLTVAFGIILLIQHFVYRKNNGDPVESAGKEHDTDTEFTVNKELGKFLNIYYS